MRATGIPTFGYDPEADYAERKEAVLKMIDWIEEYGATYDKTEPKLPLPPKQYKKILQELKRIY